MMKTQPALPWEGVLAADMALTRGLPVEDENGRSCLFALLAQPDWVKARWRAAVLQNAKLYCRAWAGFVESGSTHRRSVI